jgi:hypothetical protein
MDPHGELRSLCLSKPQECIMGNPTPVKEEQTSSAPVMEEKRTVQTQRRRRTTPSSEPRERADAPERDQPSSGGGSEPPRSPGGPSGSGGSSGPAMPMGGGGGGLMRNPLMMILAVIVIGLFFILPRLTGGGDSGQLGDLGNTGALEPAANQAAVAQPTATRMPRPTAASAPAAGGQPGQRWLIMLYQNADDKVLEKDIFVDLNEAERVGSSDRVQIVSQIDRFQGGFQGDGDWTSTRRYYVTQDADLERIGSELIADIGETNMADGNTLVDFATWAIETYPADRHVLILSDHGLGWPGGWGDPTAGGGANRNLPISSVLGDQLYLAELDQALEAIRQQSGLEKLELVGMDACLMGHLEVYGALEPHARFAVASQETEPALGWAYASFLGALQANPDMSGAELSQLIVDSYIVDDARITDDAARADLVGRSLFGSPSADQVSAQLSQNMTISAVDLSGMPALMDSVNSLAYGLQQLEQRGVAQARSYSQAFTSIFGDQVPPSYIDLGHFVQLLTQTTRDQTLTAAAGAVVGALEQTVVAEKHGPQRAGATGVSVYFPNSQLYRLPTTGPQSYLAVADRFAEQSLWDDYLTFHYTGQQFDAAPAAVTIPERTETIEAPGRGAFQVGPVEASAQSVAPGETVTLRADVSGENIGYIKLFVGFLDQDSRSINVADMDYLESPETHEVNGVFYPDWGEGDFTVEFAWEPIVFAVNDGATRAEALFTPESYGATYQQATYTVDGVYTFADGSGSRSARLYFQDETLRQIFSFTAENGQGAPWEISPAPGDSFTVLEQWMDLDDNGAVTQVTTEPGETVTFTNQTFTWEVLDAAAGDYVVGFIVEDLDGNQQATYTAIQVE